MKVIEAFWETRNLSKMTFEIQIDKNDVFENFLKTEENIIKEKGEYIVVKIPTSQAAWTHRMFEQGYAFAETCFELTIKRATSHVPKYIERMDRNIEIRQVQDQVHIGYILKEIMKGLFDTDRISLDPNFSLTQAAIRYANWTKDMLAKGDALFEATISNKPFGFFTLTRLDQKTAYPTLMSCYHEYKNKGLGILLTKKCHETVWNLGYEQINTSVVSNNYDVLKCNLLLGAQIDSMHYTYIKHVR